MNIPQSLRYTESHEWIRVENDGTITVGITDHAQDALGDIVFLELPTVGKSFTAGSACAVVESVKAASDIYAPVTGEIIGTNEEAANGPGASCLATAQERDTPPHRRRTRLSHRRPRPIDHPWPGRRWRSESGVGQLGAAPACAPAGPAASRIAATR